MCESNMKAWFTTSLLVLSCAQAACIEDEKTRSYDEFVAEYQRLQADVGATPQMDAGADLPIMKDMSVEVPDMAPDMPFVVDPNDPPECSINGGDAVTVEFVNSTNQDIDLYWYNPVCVPIKYANIPVGGAHIQPTFVGHVWGWMPRFVTPFNQPERRAVIFDDAMTRVEFEEVP